MVAMAATAVEAADLVAEAKATACQVAADVVVVGLVVVSLVEAKATAAKAAAAAAAVHTFLQALYGKVNDERTRRMCTATLRCWGVACTLTRIAI